MPTIRNLAGHETNSILGRPIPAGDSDVTDEEWALLDGNPYVELVSVDPGPRPAAPEAPAAETPDQLKAEAQQLLDQAAAEEQQGVN